jgi:hypothetical protein
MRRRDRLTAIGRRRGIIAKKKIAKKIWARDTTNNPAKSQRDFDSQRVW